MKLAVYREEQMNTSVAIENEVEAEPARRRFTVDEFQRMGEAGIFAPDERVELIGGEVIQMTPIGPWHMEAVFALEDYLRPIVGPEVRVSVQMPVELLHCAPYPDVALLKRSEMLSGKLPGPSACLLVVKVSDSTVRFDRNQKRLDYADSGISEYWVLDLPSQAVVVHLEPVAGDYRNVTEYLRGSSFRSPALGGRRVSADDVLLARP
jgi:Uma2 family endonuclease